MKSATLHRIDERHFARADGGPQRFVPRQGQQLTMANIRGAWRPSGTVAGAGLWAVVWSTGRGVYWAALHDFEPADQLRLVEACRRVDLEQGRPGARCWP